jgi:hypothetical protein
MNRFKLELNGRETQTLHTATRDALYFHGFKMTDETPHAIAPLTAQSWYAETSQIDELVRLYVRLNRILAGHKQYNAVIPYTRRPKS